MVDDIIVILFVDDILFTGSNSKLVKNVIHQLVSKFALKDLREFNYFRGLKVTLSVEGLHLSLAKYIGNFLKKAHMVENKGCPTPMSSLDAALDNPPLYRCPVGSLQYMTLTRLEIAFIVNKLR